MQHDRHRRHHRCAHGHRQTPGSPGAAAVTAEPAGWNTAIGVILTAVMLFPVYWMINVSLTPPNKMRQSPPSWFPLHPTFDGYRAVLHDQLPYLGTSLLIGLGTVILTVVIAAPAGYSLAKLRPRGHGDAL